MARTTIVVRRIKHTLHAYITLLIVFYLELAAYIKFLSVIVNIDNLKTAIDCWNLERVK